MRIVGGKFRGRRFHPPANQWPTRPTTDFAKEGLFNILLNRIDFEGTKMLDLFGGTGNHTYEAISHGCRAVTYVEKHYPCIKFVKETCSKLGIENHVQIVKSDVAKYLKRSAEAFDYIFAGPPYGLPWLDDIPDMVLGGPWLSQQGLFVLEHNQQHDFKGHLNFQELRTYGGTHFSFFGAKDTIAD